MIFSSVSRILLRASSGMRLSLWLSSSRTKVAQRLAEDVGLPDFLRRVTELAEQVVHQFLGLLFRADDRVDLGADIGAEQMDGRRRRAKPHAVVPALTDDFRLFELQLVDGRHDDAVAGLAHLVERAAQALVARRILEKSPRTEIRSAASAMCTPVSSSTMP